MTADISRLDSRLKSSLISRASRGVIMSTLNVAKSSLPSVQNESPTGKNYETDMTPTVKTDSPFTGNSHAKNSLHDFKPNELTSAESVHITRGSDYYEEVTTVLVQSSKREGSTELFRFESESTFATEIQSEVTSVIESGTDNGGESVDSMSYSGWIDSTWSFLSGSATSVPIVLESSGRLLDKDMLSSSESSFTIERYASSSMIDMSYVNDGRELSTKVTSTSDRHTIIHPPFRG